VHTPETSAEKVTENVVRKVKELGITYPVLVDEKAENWRRWEQSWWPTVYLIDRKGVARYRWAGELDWEGAGGERQMGRAIDQLLAESK